MLGFEATIHSTTMGVEEQLETGSLTRISFLLGLRTVGFMHRPWGAIDGFSLGVTSSELRSKKLALVPD